MKSLGRPRVVFEGRPQDVSKTRLLELNFRWGSPQSSAGGVSKKSVGTSLGVT